MGSGFKLTVFVPFSCFENGFDIVMEGLFEADGVGSLMFFISYYIFYHLDVTHFISYTASFSYEI